MQIDQLREFCVSKKGVTESFPFDNDTLVFKVMGKMFNLVPLDKWEEGHEICIVKLDPEWAIELRESFDTILGGFQQGKSSNAKYVNTKHWNTIVNNKNISDDFIEELINHSYNLVLKGLNKKTLEEYSNL